VLGRTLFRKTYQAKKTGTTGGVKHLHKTLAQGVYVCIIESSRQRNGEDEMAQFNAQEVAREVAAHQYRVFEYEAFGHVMRKFGVTHLTAKKWVNRALAQGALKRHGKAAVALV